MIVSRGFALLLAAFVWLIAIPLVHGLLPWVISLMTPRYGWLSGGPSPWNWPGLILIVAGAALLLWVLFTGVARMPSRVRLGLTPPSLLTEGPYRFTRNPMYVAEAGLWLGFAIFFGCPAVFLGFLIVILGANYFILPREERGLEAAFGQTYRQYKNTRPRWLGKAKP